MKRNYILIIILICISCSKTQKEYYSDGSLKAEYVINNEGQFNGVYKEFYENGKRKAQVDFKNGHKDGVAEFCDSTGLLTHKEYFQHDEIKHCKEFTSNGKIVYEFSFLDTLNLPRIDDFNIQLSNRENFFKVGDTTQINISCDLLSKNNLKVIITNGMQITDWQKDSFIYSFVPKQVGKSKIIISVNTDNRSEKYHYIGFKEYEIQN